MDVHHLLLDGWSVPLVLREVAAAYDSAAAGRPWSAPRPRAFRTYIDWLQRRDPTPAEHFWRGMLADVATATPLDLGRPAMPAAGYRTYTRTFDRTDALAQAARRAGLTLNTLVQGAWAYVLHRYSGRDDVVFGVAIAGRPAELAGVEAMVGVFINTLPFRARVSWECDLRGWLRALQAQQTEIEAHAVTPLVDIQGWSAVPRGQPLFETLLVFENYPVFGPTDSAWPLSAVRVREQTHYPLTVVVAPGPPLKLQLLYDRARFDGAAIARLTAQLEAVLAAMAETIDLPLAALPPLSPAEGQLIAAWNGTAAPFPAGRCLHALVSDQATRAPHEIAVLAEDATLTYAELDRRANQLAHLLRGLGVGPEVCVGVCLDQSCALVVALLAVLKAGGAYVPLEPGYPTARLAFMLADAGARLLITTTTLQDRCPGDFQTVVCLDTPEAAAAALAQPVSAPVELAHPDGAAYVIYTSGSTGRPKGVVISHRSLVNFLVSMCRRPGITSDDVLVAVTAVSFDIAALELFLPLVAGARVVIASRTDASDGSRLAALMRRHGATCLQATPITWRLMLAADDRACAELTCLCGGEALPSELAQELLGRDARVWNMYGPTETTVWSAVQQVHTAEGPVPIGRPIANTQLHVLDARLAPVPIGVGGELYIGGDGLARGYRGQPALTAARFVPDPFGQPGARLYRTGDLARWRADGSLDFLGRIDHQVKVRGVRIELGEIELALARDAAIREAIVVATGDGADRRLVAYLIPAGDERPTIDLVRRRLQAVLPDHMLPVALVWLDSWPLTTNGKIDRAALPRPDDSRAQRRQIYVEPRTPVEQMLAAICADVLRVDRVGIHDDFFELGGHSLRATQVAVRVRDVMDIELPLRVIFESPTVAGMCDAIHATPDGRQQVERIAAVVQRIERMSAAELSDARQRMEGSRL